LFSLELTLNPHSITADMRIASGEDALEQRWGEDPTGDENNFSAF